MPCSHPKVLRTKVIFTIICQKCPEPLTRCAVVVGPVAVETTTRTMTWGERSRTCHTLTRSCCSTTGMGGGGGGAGHAIRWRGRAIPLRGKRVMSTTTNTSTGMSGVRVGQIPGTGDGRDRSAVTTTTTTMITRRRADRIPGKRATLMIAATLNTLTGVSMVSTGWITGMGNGGDRGTTATTTTTTRAEGGLHPTPLMTATLKLAARLHSDNIWYALEASLLDMDEVNGQRQSQRAMDHPMMMKRGKCLQCMGSCHHFF